MTGRNRTPDVRSAVRAILGTRSVTGGTDWLYITVSARKLAKRRDEAVSNEIVEQLIALLWGDQDAGTGAAEDIDKPLTKLDECFAEQARKRHVRKALTPVVLSMVELGEICVSVHDETRNTFRVTPAQPHH